MSSMARPTMSPQTTHAKYDTTGLSALNFGLPVSMILHTHIQRCKLPLKKLACDM